MWDIKCRNADIIYLTPRNFHLNHVGYKARIFECWSILGRIFHLNHVGYKAIAFCFVLYVSISFHLNHVGYKASAGIFAFRRFGLSSEPCGI